MRLLNVNTLRLEEFFDTKVPQYAILSHRWGSEEVSLQEWNRINEIDIKLRTISRHPSFKIARHKYDYYHEILSAQQSELALEKEAIERKMGYLKINSFVKVLQNPIRDRRSWFHSCKHVWIDTCCIDKTNNAELSEAINSMFRWYENAWTCFAYLGDVPSGLEWKEQEKKIRSSDWFRRGWTLQELLAPRDVIFYDQGWNFLFDMENRAGLVANITGIDEDILDGSSVLSDACIAKKMSWASRRTTTRKEDLAYCLLGLFDVHMPLLYGEGDRAFIRLQEAIVQQSGDLSIFAWGYQVPLAINTHGLFADSPAKFAGCSKLANWESRGVVMSMTNITLNAHLEYYRPSGTNISFIYADLSTHDNNYLHGYDNYSLYLPLVIENDESAGDALDIEEILTNIAFVRLADARPILIAKPIDRGMSVQSSAKFASKILQGMQQKFEKYDTESRQDNWIYERHAISILKRKFIGEFQRSPSVILDTKATDAPKVSSETDAVSFRTTIEEVYPPHFLAYDYDSYESGLEFNFDNGHGVLWYPGAIKGKLSTFAHKPHSRSHDYKPVAYVRVSHPDDRRIQMVVVVSPSYDHQNRFNPHLRMCEWENDSFLSLADCEINQIDGMPGITKFLSGVERTIFGKFYIGWTETRIMISPLEDPPNGEEVMETDEE